MVNFLQTPEGIAFAKAVSRLLGWSYVLAWSTSFYPQPLSNWRRRSTAGLAIDFNVLNLLGFSSYAVSSALFLWSSTVRKQYAERHPSSPEPTVRFNDFAFGFHAVLLCLITYSQFFPAIWGFSVDPRQRISRPVMIIVSCSLLALVVGLCRALVQPVDGPSNWEWIDVAYLLSYIKLVCTLTKYIPQAYLNYKRKSTVGWSIWQILLDLTGGVLSLLQLAIDSALQGSWSGVTGNPVKFGLANMSFVFDTIFIVQHYFLYKQDARPSDQENPDRQEAEREALLGNSHED